MNDPDPNLWWTQDHESPALQPGQLNMRCIESAAMLFADRLSEGGGAHVTLEPDDGTRYEFIATKRNPDVMEQGAPYMFASSFGPAYPWNGEPTIHPGYASDKWVANRNPWTAVVMALFLNLVALNLCDLRVGRPT